MNPPFTNSNNLNRTIFEPNKTADDYSPGENDVECPEERPFFNGDECIECEDQFNLTTKECTTCPDGVVFDPELHDCVKNNTPNATNPAAYDNLLSPNEEPKQNETDNPCPEDKPFFSNESQECIACDEENPIFDVENGNCTKCGEGEMLNTTTHNCSKPNYKTNFTAGQNKTIVPNDTTIEDLNDTAESSNPDALYCPEDKPFFNGNECVDCK